ncbi:hypothetical protein GGE45_003939 [Rhizobium aethiopicum]|uniref:hypothetical protein n=1 Tax=Rhizobium aethiopicum TaxID=1138170 RepID=UPI00161E2AFE|nr:hypothetical protein [Rhizobium aethiopicum]MBB4581591.1 hypothetical protein [Rhizobium aethiopicum]
MKRAKRAASREDDSDRGAPACAEDASPTYENDGCDFDDQAADDLANAFADIDLDAFERELQEEEDVERRKKIKAEVLNRFYFKTGPYNEKRRSLLKSLGAKWERSIGAWHVPKNHMMAAKFGKTYAKVELSEQEVNALVKTILEEKKGWEENRASSQRY